MKNDLQLNLKTLKPWLKKTQNLLLQHAIFISVLVVLFAYVIVVSRINQLAGAEPSSDAETSALATDNVPRINKSTTQQIQNLEQTNTQVKALFEQARNNPFQE